MNNIDPFGFGRREQSSEPSNMNGSTGFNIQGLNYDRDDGPAGGQGIMGGQPIRQYLMPLIGQINNQMEEEKRNKIEPYVQEFKFKRWWIKRRSW